MESQKVAEKVAADKEVEAQRKLAKGEEDAKARQAAANHSTAVSNFRTLLSEMVRDPTASWHDYAARLERDPQVRGPSIMSLSLVTSRRSPAMVA